MRHDDNTVTSFRKTPRGGSAGSNGISVLPFGESAGGPHSGGRTAHIAARSADLLFFPGLSGASEF